MSQKRLTMSMSQRREILHDDNLTNLNIFCSKFFHCIITHLATITRKMSIKTEKLNCEVKVENSI